MPELLERLRKLESQLTAATARNLELESRLENTIIQNEKLNFILENQTELICRYSPDFTFIYVNRAYRLQFGLTSEELIDANFLSVIPENDREAVLAIIYSLSKDNPVSISEFQINFPNGALRWYEWTTRAIIDGNGKISEYQGVGRDITERKRTEEALRIKDKAIASTITPIALADLEGRLTYVNSAFLELWQLTEVQEVLGRSVVSFWDSEEAAQKILAELQENGSTRNKMVARLSNGQLADVELTASTVVDEYGKPLCFMASFNDITDRIRAEKAFRRNESLYRVLTETMKDVVWALDTETLYFRYVSPSVEQLRGYTPEEILEKPMDEALMPGAREAMRTKIRLDVKAFLAGQELPGAYSEVEQPCKDGSTVWTEVNTRYYYNAETGHVEVVGVTRDITKRKQVEEALRTSEEKYRSLLESSDASISMLDKDGNFLFANKIAATKFRSESTSIIGKNLLELIPYWEAAKLLRLSQQVIASSQGEVVEIPQTQEGKIRWFRTSIQPVLGANGTPFAAMINSTDITSIKEAEIARHESEELFKELVKQLPGTVAIFDQKNNLRFCNEFYAQSVGYTSQAILGKELESFLPSEICAKVLQENEQVLSQMQVMEINYKTLNSRHWLIIKFPIPRQGLPPLIGAIGLDVTREKEAEEVLQRAHDILEQRVAERTAELERNQADLESIIESTSLAFILYDLEGNIRVVNKLAEKYNLEQYGIRLEPGNSMLGYILPAEHPTFLERVERVKAGENLSFVNTVTNGDKISYFEYRYYPVKSSVGEIIGATLAFEDITRRKENELELSYMASLQENMRETVIATDLKFNIKNINRAAENIYGWPVAEVIGKPLGTVIPTTVVSEESREKAIDILMEKGFWNGESIQIKRDGTKLHVLSSIALLKDREANPTGLVVVNHDITDRKQAEAVLEEKRKQERELQEYLKALHEISVELTAISQLDEFYKKVVELGLARLGFERLAFFIYDFKNNLALGTYGTNKEGKLIDEHNLKFEPIRFTGSLSQAMHYSDRYIFVEEAPLFANGEFIGVGWNAAVSLWQSTKLLGWLTIDNAVKHKPVNRTHLEVLSLYRMTVAAILANKLVEEKLQTTSQRLKLATKTGGIGIWDWNLKDNSLVWDDQMYALYGTTRETFSDNYDEWLTKFLHPDDLEPVQTIVNNALSTDKPYEIEFRIFWPNGSLHHIKSNILTLLDEMGQPVSQIWVNWDFTNQKRGEEALKEALKKEKDLGELKTRFVTRASHEFRTPLAAILATTETLSIYRSKMTEPQIDARLDKIRQQVTYMTGIMEDVLELSRLQANKLEFRPSQVNLDELCQSVINEFDSQAEYKNRIVYSCTNSPVIAIFDLQLIRQVIRNLVTNALKYSPGEKPVYLDLSQDSMQVTLKVKDEGIGIPPEDMKVLFEPFHRARNVGTIAGTGLGLSIALESVELHGGTILVESELEVGTTFILYLPN